MLNDSIHYVGDALYCDGVAVAEIIADVGTPTYIYSGARVLHNYQQIVEAFAPLGAHVHYSAKANANLHILKLLIGAGAGIDVVSVGEIARAQAAGCPAEQIVFAGVGKTPEELAYAVQQGVGWVNVENVDECRLLNQFAAAGGRTMRVALRFNPDVQANTHPNIATGHKGAKFGLNADDIRYLLNHQADYPALDFAGIHVLVGSQLGDTHAPVQGIQSAVDLVRPYPQVRTLDIGGGFPAPYTDAPLPSVSQFAQAIAPLVAGYDVILEPGRSIVADAGILVTRWLYIKQQGGVNIYIVDAGMTELIRPALYHAHHDIVPLHRASPQTAVQVVGPVCESSDVFAKDAMLPALQHGDLLALLDVGAYGMVMASNYNQRLRPAEVIVDAAGESWQVSRRRETLADLAQWDEI